MEKEGQKMKYKVIKAFVDKETMKLHVPSKHEYETNDKKRAEELIEKGFIKEKKKTNKKE